MQQRGRVDWKASISHHLFMRSPTRFLAFVEDAAHPHLQQIHNSQRCSFATSWKAFNEQGQGHHHRVLSWCQWLLGVFLLVGTVAVAVVQFHLNHIEANGGKARSKRFHIVVALKFLLQDAPQQLCIVLYILGWYEAGGLRCQMCLFDSQYCSDEDPFHLANFAAFTCVLLSSVANQLLIKPIFKKTYTEDDICIHYTIRIGGTCLSILPFTTGICFASRTLIPMASTLHFFFAVPAALGWVTLAGGICVPLAVCCDEDYDI